MLTAKKCEKGHANNSQIEKMKLMGNVMLRHVIKRKSLENHVLIGKFERKRSRGRGQLTFVNHNAKDGTNTSNANTVLHTIRMKQSVEKYCRERTCGRHTERRIID